MKRLQHPIWGANSDVHDVEEIDGREPLTRPNVPVVCEHY